MCVCRGQFTDAGTQGRAAHLLIYLSLNITNVLTGMAYLPDLMEMVVLTMVMMMLMILMTMTMMLMTTMTMMLMMLMTTMMMTVMVMMMMMLTMAMAMMMMTGWGPCSSLRVPARWQ